MKRSSRQWILLFAGILWINLEDVQAVRATSLIFGKSTTTTSTEASAGNSSESAQNEGIGGVTEAGTEVSNATGPTLTGIPQVDYVFDPNLPKEINGYNLTEYPFYERVPEDVGDFKCDGLHDGFYASVLHKCQVYHHCLYGTRYDFLCANYTAFDQKTFICQFVSEVDCVNSKKYWHRNDALYQEASTTTVKPVIVYTPPPPPPDALGRRRPNRPRAPPPSRRHQYEYDDDDYEEEYDDYYEEKPRRRKRPRRPVYRDEYDDEYEDERPRSRRRRPTYERRGDRRPERRGNKERRKYEKDDSEEGRRDTDRRKQDYDEVEEDSETRIPDRAKEREHPKRRPSVDYDEVDRRRNRPKGSKRPVHDDEEERPLKNKTQEFDQSNEQIKPTSGSSIYDRPRAAPRIKPPVPKSESRKYAYKPISTTQSSAEHDELYYDDYEEEQPIKPNRKTESNEKRNPARRNEERNNRKQTTTLKTPQPTREEEYEDDPPKLFKERSKSTFLRTTPKPSRKQIPIEEEYEDEYEDEPSKSSASNEDRVNSKEKPKDLTTTTAKPTTSTTTTKPTTTATVTTTVKDVLRPESIVRIVKRPFLPSRGGNPFTARGLQPVGAKAAEKNPEKSEEEIPSSETKPKTTVRPKFSPSTQTEANEEEFKPISNRPQLPPRPTFKPNKEFSGPRTTQKPKIDDPLDIEEDEYDVTLNDALNPTLPNLPTRNYPTGFSTGNDYGLNAYQRPRYAGEASNNDYVYQPKVVRQRYEPIAYTTSQDQFVNSDTDYKGQYSTIQQQYRPRVTHVFFPNK